MESIKEILKKINKFCILRFLIKLTYLIATLLFGILLNIIILIGIFKFFPNLNILNLTFPEFKLPNINWNSLATIVGAIITGLITWFAVYKTSELDKKARRNECNYKYVQEKLFKFYDLLEELLELNRIYFSESKQDKITIPTIELNTPTNLINLLHISMQLQYFNISFKDKLVNFDKIINNFISIQSHLIKAIISNSDYVQRDSKSHTIDLKIFFKYLSENYSDIDLSDRTDDIFEIRELVLTQFKLEEK